MRPSEVVTGAGIDLSGTNSENYKGLAPYGNVSFQCVWSGVTGTAAIKLQASNDGSNFDDVSGYTGSTSGSSGSLTWQLCDTSALWYRVTVTSAASAGTLTVTAVGNEA